MNKKFEIQPGSEDKLFTFLREELRHWPYTLHQIEETLDVGLIEGRGKQLLFQSINSNRLMAHVGAGHSMAYGRLTWSGWRNRLKAEVEKTSLAFAKLCAATVEYQSAVVKSLDYWEKKNNKIARERADNDKPIEEIPEFVKSQHLGKLSAEINARRKVIGVAWNEITKLQRTFEAAMEENAKFPGGDALPIQLQVVKQLHELLRAQSELFLPDGDDGQSSPSP